MKRSEIFESFVKIAQDQGLLSDEKPTNERVEAEHTEKDFHETNPRHDSLSIEQIGKLYNTKPAQPKDMEYKKNIMEDAHPEPVVLFMAHDKLNALIENENEGQNARIRIVLKEPDGHLTQRKYAQKELVMSLVRLANDLDNNDQDELRKLADICLSQATDSKKKVLSKTAIAPMLIIGALVAGVGLLYAKEHLPQALHGWQADYTTAQEKIEALENSHTSFGVGYAYKPELLQMLNQLKGILAEIDGVVQKVLPTLEELEAPRTESGITQEIAKMSTGANGQKANQAVSDLRTVMTKNLPFIRQVLANFSNEGYKQRMIADEGTISSWIDSAQILHGGWGLFSDKFDDVSSSLTALRKDLVNLVKTLKGMTNVQQVLQTRLQSSQQEMDLDLKDEAQPGAPPAGGASPPAAPSPTGGALESVENAFSGLTSGVLPH